MGYQESFIRITDLAEATKIKEEMVVQDTGLSYYCATQAKRNMYLDPIWTSVFQSTRKEPFICEGDLFVVVGGQRSDYPKGQSFIFADSIKDLEASNSQDYFEDLPDNTE